MAEHIIIPIVCMLLISETVSNHMLVHVECMWQVRSHNDMERMGDFSLQKSLLSVICCQQRMAVIIFVNQRILFRTTEPFRNVVLLVLARTRSKLVAGRCS